MSDNSEYSYDDQGLPMQTTYGDDGSRVEDHLDNDGNVTWRALYDSDGNVTYEN